MSKRVRKPARFVGGAGLAVYCDDANGMRVIRWSGKSWGGYAQGGFAATKQSAKFAAWLTRAIAWQADARKPAGKGG